MPGYFCKARQRYVGVDIGSHTIKIVELSRSNGPFQLEAYAVEPLSATLMDDQTSAEPKSVAQVLLKALGAASVSAREAVVALPDTHVICKHLAVDAGLSDDDLELYVRLEAEQYIPYALDEAALDFDVLGPSPNNPQQLQVLLVTCRQHTLAWYEAVLSQAGLKARVVAVQAHALARAIEGATPLGAEAQLLDPRLSDLDADTRLRMVTALAQAAVAGSFAGWSRSQTPPRTRRSCRQYG